MMEWLGLAALAAIGAGYGFSLASAVQRNAAAKLQWHHAMAAVFLPLASSVAGGGAPFFPREVSSLFWGVVYEFPLILVGFAASWLLLQGVEQTKIMWRARK